MAAGCVEEGEGGLAGGGRCGGVNGYGEGGGGKGNGDGVANDGVNGGDGGSEGWGLRKVTGDHCDHLINIPMAGKVDCLNVSVSAGVCLYAAVRPRTPRQPNANS